MANKQTYIKRLYKDTLKSISYNPNEWLSFLESAAMNYKRPFNDQVLIYAQQPDAICCDTIENLNKNSRWANRGSKGIALIREKDGNIYLDFVFDLNKTNNIYGKAFRVWKVSKAYEEDVMESLTNKYNIEEITDNIEETIISASKILVEDNLQDYLIDIMDYRKSSQLEKLNENSISEIMQDLLSKSVAFQIMKRCGLNPNNYFDFNDFSNIRKFNTVDTITRIGVASSDISEMALREIYDTIKNLRINEIVKIRTFEKENIIDYDISERRDNYEDNLYNSRRLSDTQLDIRTEEQNESEREVRDKEIKLPEEREESSIYQSIDGREVGQSFDGYSRPSNENGRNIDEELLQAIHNNGEDERTRSDGVGSSNELIETDGRRTDNERLDLQLGTYKKDPHSVLKVVLDSKVNQILSLIPHLRKSNEEIVDYFNNEEDTIKRTKFIKDAYNTEYTGIIVDDTMYGYKAFDNGLLLWKGNFLTRDEETFIKWDSLIYNYDSMILLNQLNTKVKNIPSVNDQIETIKENMNKPTPLEFTQEFIDKFYQEMHVETRYLIYNQLRKSLSSKDNVDFLKDFFGMGGCSASVKGSGVGYDYSSKGLTLYSGYDEDRVTYHLNWNTVQKRIKELISLDRYLNQIELEEFPNYLEKREKEIEDLQRFNPYSTSSSLATRINDFAKDYDYYGYQDNLELSETEEDVIESIERQLNNPIEIRGIIDFLEGVNNELEDGSEEKQTVLDLLEEVKEIFPDYDYQIRDIVYIGAKKYEILEVNDKFVSLYDFDAPLFNEEMSFEEFDRKVKENPSNGHLKVKTPKKERVLKTITPLKEIKEENSYIVARLEEEEKYAELHYAEIETTIFTTVEYGRKVSDDKWEKEEEEIDWLDTNLSDEYVLKKLNYEFNLKYTPNEEYEKRVDEMNLLDKVLGWHKIYDIEFSFDENFNLVAYDEDNVWTEKEIFDFVLDEVISYSDTDEISEREQEALKKLEEYRQSYNKQKAVDFTKKLPLEGNNEINKQTEEIIKPQFVEEKKRKRKVSTFDIHPEISLENRNQYRINNDKLGVGTEKEKFYNNLEAIDILKQCEKEDRFATPEEQEKLVKFVSWGGLASAFDKNNSLWKDENLMLKNALTEKEYNDAEETTVNAFYTPPIVIRAMYDTLERMGLKTGNILEPSCGIGNFIGMLPDSLSKCKIYGVELDSISGRIARQLYQKSSIAIQGYESCSLPDSFFDVAIGNVPFGEYKLYDKRYDKNNFLVHDYFFAKTLDKVRPGGVIAFITSKGTMDKENPSIRKYISQRADLLGAVRLPNITFQANAGTKVTADILFLQKRDSITDIEPDWVYLDTDENNIKMNKYFVDNPDMIIGQMKMVPAKYGLEPGCVLDDESELEVRLRSALYNINVDYEEYDLEELEEEDLSVPADFNVKNFSYTLVDGKVYYRENSRMYPQELAVTTENRIKSLIEIRDCVRTILEYQLEDYSDEDIKSQQSKLNRLYDSFNRKYGLINSRANNSAFSNDSSYYLLCSLEILDDDGNLKRKADIFNKRTIRPKIKIEKADSATDALIISMSEKACVDLDYMTTLIDKTKEELIEELKGEIFKCPTTEGIKYLTADEYLSGNVRETLRIAEEYALIDPSYNINVEYLKRVQPEDLTASEIDVRLGSTWLPPDVIKEFVVQLLELSYYTASDVKINYMPSTCVWNIEGKNCDNESIKINRTYGTERINALKIIEDSLNLKDSKVFNYYEINGKKIAELDKEATALAQAKQETIKQAFKDWIWDNPERRNRLVKIYNETFNTYRNRKYDGSHIKFFGMNPEIKLREHQADAVARILYSGNTLLAHEVGAGKTFTMVAAAMESKRLGLCNKSLFVVPNHIVDQFGQEFLQLYPSANILVATKKDFEKARRKKLCSRIATGDYDAIIIGHSQFEKIPISIDRQISMIEKQIKEISKGIEELKASNGERFSIKQMKKTEKALKYKLEKLTDSTKKDDVITFEELGVDRLFIDEAHYYKNLYLYTKMRNVGGIAQTEAQKSSDLYMKCRYLDELTGGKGVIFATGTPISNSMCELYTMQRYLQYSELEKRGLQHFDAWASTFGETVTTIELSPEGKGYRPKTRFAKFFNIPELMALFREVADIQTADMLNLPVPKCVVNNIVVKPTDIQLEMIDELGNRADLIRKRAVKPHIDNMLKITNEGRNLAQDQRNKNPLLPDDVNNKATICSDLVFELWEKTSDKKSTQLIFSDISTPTTDDSFSIYNEIKRKLIDKGIPENEIEFIHNAKNEAQKLEMFSKVRQGKIRILMGSTVKMGAGTNCQNKLVAIYNIDVPWLPSSLAQRRGRMVRQGNENEEVYEYNLITERTFDAYMYQLVENKQRFISQIMTSKTPVRHAEDIDETVLSYAEIKALAAGNPEIIEKTELDSQIAKLRLLKQTYLSQKYDLEDKLNNYYPIEIPRIKKRITEIQSDIDYLDDNKRADIDFVGMNINGVFYDEKKKAGEKLIESFKGMQTTKPVEIGEYKGFKMELSYDSFSSTFFIKLQRCESYKVEMGTDVFGNITRLDNRLDAISKDISSLEVKLEELQKNYEQAKEEIKKPFLQEEELKTKEQRLTELNAKLKLDDKENDSVLMDDEPEQDEENNRTSRDYER